MRKLCQRKLTVLKARDDVANLVVIPVRNLSHSQLLEQKKSPARKLRTGVVVSKVQNSFISSASPEISRGRWQVRIFDLVVNGAKGRRGTPSAIFSFRSIA